MAGGGLDYNSRERRSRARRPSREWESMVVCYQCGQEVDFEGKVMRRDTCPSCHSTLHCCRRWGQTPAEEYDASSAHHHCC